MSKVRLHIKNGYDVHTFADPTEEEIQAAIEALGDPNGVVTTPSKGHITRHIPARLIREIAVDRAAY